MLNLCKNFIKSFKNPIELSPKVDYASSCGDIYWSKHSTKLIPVPASPELLC